MNEIDEIHLHVAVLLALVAAVYVSVRTTLGQHTVGVILAGLLAQQLAFIAGAWLRIARLGAEVEVACRTRPDPPPARVPEPIDERRAVDAAPAGEALPPAQAGPSDVG